MSQVTIEWNNVKDFKDQLKKSEREIDKASVRGLIELANIAESEAKKNFQGSHARGMPHVGGAQPNIVTGNLRRSIMHSQPLPVGVGVFTAKVWPNAVYARSVELGNPRSHSGAYPYFAPALHSMKLRINEVMAAVWAEHI